VGSASAPAKVKNGKGDEKSDESDSALVGFECAHRPRRNRKDEILDDFSPHILWDIVEGG
jgi:hypothetical protein